MRNSRVFACLLLYGITLLAWVGAKAAAPTLRLPDTVVPQSYQVSLSLDPAEPTFSGEVTIDLTIKAPVSAFWLNAKHLKVKSAVLTVGGKSLTAKTAPSGEEFLSLSFAKPLPVGKARLRLVYSGSVNQNASAGIFRSQDAGENYLFTQFEATDARAAFPCFDEPGYKTPWQLTLRIPRGLTAVSNTPVARVTPAGTQQAIVFERTKPLPSYLVAFGVGPFDIVEAGSVARSGAPVRIITPKGKADEAHYAAEVTATILSRLENYFGIAYPYPKADQVAIPVTFGFGAMENPGLVTYAQTLILAKPESDSIPRQRIYAEVAAHELSHQWFGDYVTPAWWDDIWLNEAFATWLQKTMTAEWKPEWNTRVDDVGAKLNVMEEDSLVSARKIRQEILSPNDIANAFDGITYQKGAAVIGMFEHYRGAADFQEGVRAYMHAHAYGNATTQDFLAAQDGTSGKPIAHAFMTFLTQPGVPLLSVSLNCGSGVAPTLHVAQQRLLPIGSQGSATQTWKVPMCMRYPVGSTTRSECTLLSSAADDYPLAAAGNACPAWVEANDAARGYYAVDYQGPLFMSLIEGGATLRLSAAERLDVLGNAKLLVEAGKLPADRALTLAETFHDDPDRHVVEQALDLALGYRDNLVPAALLPNYQRYLERNFHARASALGWTATAGESDDSQLLRRALVRPLATVGGDAALAESGRELTDRWLAGKVEITPEMLESVLATGAYYGDLGLAERFIDKLGSTQDRQVRSKIIRAMGSFRDPAAIQALYAAVLSGKVPYIEGFRLLFAGQEFEATRPLAFKNVQAHFDELVAKRPTGGPSDFAAYLPQVGRSDCDPESRKALNDFFASRAAQFKGGPRTLAQVLEGIDLCIARKAAQERDIAEFLKQY